MFRHSFACCIALILLSVVAVSHVSAQELLQNGSFEQGNFVDDGTGFMTLLPGATDITSWTTQNAELIWGKNGNNASLAASDGQFFLDLTGHHNSAPYGGVSQSVTTVIGQTYRLTLDIGTNQDSDQTNGPVSVQVMAGNHTQTFTTDPTGTGNQWRNFQFDFTADSGSTLISIVGQSGKAYIGLDNVSVRSVPAPGALLTAIMGALPGTTLLLRRRRTR